MDAGFRYFHHEVISFQGDSGEDLPVVNEDGPRCSLLLWRGLSFEPFPRSHLVGDTEKSDLRRGVK